MNCFNLSKPEEKKEYQRLSEYSNIPAFINKVFDHTNGKTKGIKSKEDFNKVLKSALDKVIKSPALKDTASKLPLSRFTFEQREELVDNIIFLAAFDGDTQSLKPLKKIFLGNAKEFLLAAKQSANPVYHSNYDEALKPENLEFLINMATAKLNSMGVQVDLEEDPDSKNDGMKEFEDSFLIENKTRARAFVKLLVGSLPKKELGTTLGITKFVPYDKTFNDLEELLSDVYIEPGQDAYEVFKDKINSATSYRPEYIQLLKFLDKASDQHKIQFIRAFSTLSINFSSSSIDVTKDGMGVETSYMSSDSVTAESQILLLWEGAFKEYFIKEGKEPEANNIPTIKAAEDRYKNKIKKELRKRIKKGETTITQEDFKDATGILGFLGIGIKENALKLYLSDTADGNDLESLNNLYTNVIDKVFYGTSFSTNALNSLVENKVDHEDGYVKSPITDESEIKKLASYQAKFDETIVTNGFPGPDGKIYQTKSQYDYASKVAEDIKNSNDYLEKIEGSDFNTNSKFIEQLKDPKVKKNFRIEHFNSRRSKGQDGGKTMKDLSPVDEYADRIDRVLTKGQLSYLTLADKNRLYFINGLKVFSEDASNKIKDKDLVSSSKVSKEMVDTVLGYFADELISSRRYFIINKVATKGQKKKLLTGIEGNMKTSTILPGLSFGSKEGDENGLYHSDGTPFKMSTSYIEEVGDPKNPEIVINPGFFSNSNLRDYITNVLDKRILASSQTMLDTLFTFDNKGILEETAISTDLFKTFINPKISNKKKPTRNEVLEGINVMATNFVYKSIVGNVEWSKIFTGDPRKYKSLEDYMKRTPATSATGDHLYINEDIGSKRHFNLAIASDIDEHNAEELTIAANIDNIAEWIGVGKDDEELNTILSAYNKNNRTDAQGWMTMDRFKDILKGLGEWNQELESGFNRLKKGTETYEDIKLFSTKMTSMQPKKGMYYSLVVDDWGNVNPIYLKYSTAVLFPGMIKSSPKLAKIAEQMKAQKIDELVVGDGVKVGKIASTDITNDEIKFTPITLENKYWKLQQDLPFKDKETNVGSQLQKNIISDIDLLTDFGPYGTGEDMLKLIHSTVSELSNRGFDKVLNKLGLEKEEVRYDEETGRWEIDSRANLNKLYDSLIEEYINDGETGDIIQMLKERQPLDFIYTHGNTIMSKVTSIFTKNSIKLEQPGGSAIQMSNFGFDLGDDRGVAKTISQLPDNIKNDIIWLQKENELTAPTVKTNNKTGELEFSRAQVALPYSALEKLFGEEWKQVKDLPIDELKDRIDPKALQGIGYRIPNQKLASNDPIEIVAILPPTAGNTIVAYAAVTTKTGSDFDIDKMYYVMRPIKKSKKNGKTYIKAVEYLDENSTVEERAQALVGNTSELARVMSMLYDTESVKSIINDMNDWYAIKETAYYKKGLKLREEEEKISKIFLQIKELKTKLSKASRKEKENIIIDIADLQFALSRVTREEDMVMEAVNKYRKDLVISVSEKIKDFSIDEQNTKRALQSRRVDLYDAVLTHPSSYLRLMSTVDSDWLKDHINMTLPKPKLGDLEFYTGEYHMKARQENISSKSGVGQVANHQVDHAISQWADIYLNQENRIGMGNMTEEGMVDLSGKTIGNFEVIVAYDKDGNKIDPKDLSNSKPVRYEIEKVIENKVLITEVTSAYMNAFVDAAKDNYIGRANFNRLTNNTAFLLVRAGVSPQFVNALLSQPIIKDYVKETMVNEGQATPISSKKPIDKVLDKYGEGIMPSESSKLSDFNTLDMMNTILKYQNSKEDIESLDASERLEQVELLGLFMHIVETSKHLRDAILSTKSDTGIGKSLFDAYIITTTRDNVRNVNLIGNYDKKFEKDDITTMAGTFYKNGPAAANEIVGKQTLLGTSGMQKYLHNTYRQLWGELPSDSRKLRKLYNMGVGALVSYISDFSMTQEESAAFNSGANSIAKRIVKLQNSDEYKDNFLASMLVTDISYNGDISYVGINNFKPRNPSINKQISNAWQELYEDPKTKQLATDLAKYAFHSSGTMDTGSTLYRLMPYRIAQQLGLNTEIYNKIRNALNNNDVSQSLMNQVLINSWYDTELVPKIPKKNALQIDKSPTGIIFKVNDISSPGLKVGITEDNQPVFKPYVRRTLSNKLATGRTIYEDALFKYVGNIQDSETGYESGVYKRVPRFGTKQGIFKLFEFTFKDPNRNSVVKYNKLTPFISTAVNKELAKIQGSLIDPQSVHMKSQRNVIKEYGNTLEAEEKEDITKSSKDRMPYYEGKVTSLEENQVFVFGSNPEGRHGAGAAKFAKDNFGAISGKGEGIQGKSYALPTKDLRVKENKGLRSIPPKQIIKSINTLYEVANENSEKDFLVSDYSGKNLNGYTGQEMAEMFVDAGKIPDNIIFNKNFVTLLSKEIKKKCKGKNGSDKAEKGAQFGFTPGSKWKVIKNFKGKSHERGGIDISVGKDGIKMKGKGGDFKAENGVVIAAAGFVVPGENDDVKYNTPEYNKAHKEGTVTRYDKESDTYVAPNLPEFKVEGKDTRVTDAMKKTREDFLSTSLDALGQPQKQAVELITGKQELPSEALDIQNPVGAFVVDAVTDPLNLIGAGAANKALKASSAAKKALKPLKDSARRTSVKSKDFAEELAGYIKNNKGNKKAVAEGNAWLDSWIKHPETRKKIREDAEKVINPNAGSLSDKLDDFSRGLSEAPKYLQNIISTKDNLKLINIKRDILLASKESPKVGEYSLYNQFKDVFNPYVKDGLHTGNLGVSYTHMDEPYKKYMTVKPDLSKIPEKYKGSWISRKGSQDQTSRASTTVHEGTHDWASDGLLRYSGQYGDIMNNIKPEFRDATRKWNKLRFQGIDPTSKMSQDEIIKGYLGNPTEVHARVMELRKHFNLKPGQEVDWKDSAKMMDEIAEGNTPVTKYFVNVFESVDNFSKVFNRLWALPAVGAAGVASLNNDKDE